MLVQVIVGSSRAERQVGDLPGWAADRLVGEGHFDEVEVLDLQQWALPMFDESQGSVRLDPPYGAAAVRKWNATIAHADAYLVITPEYNHSYPGVLKNAIDSVYGSFAFRHKPIGFVGYSNGPIGASRAVEHLLPVAVELEMVPMRNTVLIRNFDTGAAAGRPADPLSHVALDILADDLAWWARLLEQGRREGQHDPGVLRFYRASLALAAE